MVEEQYVLYLFYKKNVSYYFQALHVDVHVCSIVSIVVYVFIVINVMEFPRFGWNGTEVCPNMKDGCGLPTTSVPPLVVKKGRLQLGPCDMP